MSAKEIKLDTLEEIFNKFVSKRVNRAKQDELVALNIATGCVFTLFRKNENGEYVRKITTVPEQNGLYAIGTILDSTSPEYVALEKGKIYRGDVSLFEKLYHSSYFPINKKYAGFVGVPL